MEKFSTLTHKKRTENYKIVRCRFYLSLVENSKVDHTLCCQDCRETGTPG